MKAGRSAKWMGVATAMLLLAAEVSAQGMPRPIRDRDGTGPHRMAPDSRPARAMTEDAVSQRRMTPEERRQLRRDVHQAGRDLYPERTRERRREMRRGE
ncbi:MAG: hypothetical protein HZA62_04515 [Rhodocyclales bacterium]|nr:hypothetical protein [Rhodocyclales bacterium]